MQIRQEQPADASAISSVTEAAFKEALHSNQAEAKIVAALRAAGALTISLVAVDAKKIVGHVAFSPVAVDGSIDGWYGLGPVSVIPERQRNGIGQALIREGLRRLTTINAAGCVVLGQPEYYGRFGFESDPELYYGEVPRAYFQRLIFHGPSPKGEVTYHLGFNAS